MNRPAHIEDSVRYLTNDGGERTEVIVPVDIWYQLIRSIQLPSGLDPIDEQEPNSQILADLKTALQEVKEGKTFPISELWDGMDLPNND